MPKTAIPADEFAALDAMIAANRDALVRLTIGGDRTPFRFDLQALHNEAMLDLLDTAAFDVGLPHANRAYLNAIKMPVEDADWRWN
jgi:hypothetical protein